MLLLKLLLVPIFIGLVSLAGKRWGAAVAGWLAGMPVVAGPILLLLWLGQGEDFARTAAGYSLAAITPLVAFSTTFAWLSRYWTWPRTIACAYFAWFCAALIILTLPEGLTLWLIATASLLIAPRLLPQQGSPPAAPHLPKFELAVRMAAGAALTLFVTSIASSAGTRVSGLLAMFPVISGVLVVFIHRSGGSNSVIAMLRGFVRGLFSLLAFCLVLILTPAKSTSATFAIAIVATFATQWGVVAFSKRFEETRQQIRI